MYNGPDIFNTAYAENVQYVLAEDAEAIFQREERPREETLREI
jgi:hypothetical protein